MVATLFALTALCAAPIVPAPVASDSLVNLFEGGKTWTEFFDGAKARRDMWRENYQRGEPAADLVTRARAVGGSWRVLVVAEDWCGDSANTVPYLVRLVEQVPGVELRIVNSTVGKWVMTRHPTPDGRAATPTIVLLGPEGEERGCFIERPAALRAWVAENKPKLSDDDFQSGKMGWYRSDAGQSTVTEMVEILEAAAAGSTRCGGR
ncbi:MAG: thioredoxin family protein [Gemmatimonadales bacterium]|nr:thioredoxin family protein [Gemmatimonadales bacterium]